MTFPCADDVLDRLAGNITLEHGLQGVRRPFDGAFLDSLDPFDLAHTLALPCNGNTSNAPVMVMSRLLNNAEDARKSGDDFSPIVLMTKDDHRITEVFQAFPLSGFKLSA